MTMGSFKLKSALFILLIVIGLLLPTAAPAATPGTNPPLLSIDLNQNAETGKSAW